MCVCVCMCLSGPANPLTHPLTHSAVVRPKARVALLVGEVGDKQQAEGVPGRGDDPGGRHRLRVRCLPPAIERQQLALCLHLPRGEGEGITDSSSIMFVGDT